MSNERLSHELSGGPLFLRCSSQLAVQAPPLLMPPAQGHTASVAELDTIFSVLMSNLLLFFLHQEGKAGESQRTWVSRENGDSRESLLGYATPGARPRQPAQLPSNPVRNNSFLEFKLRTQYPPQRAEMIHYLPASL